MATNKRPSKTNLKKVTKKNVVQKSTATLKLAVNSPKKISKLAEEKQKKSADFNKGARDLLKSQTSERLSTERGVTPAVSGVTLKIRERLAHRIRVETTTSDGQGSTITKLRSINGYNSSSGDTQAGYSNRVAASSISLVLFKEGDKIVYPGHGVGEIETIKTSAVGGSEQQFYSIKILETGMKVMVPVSQSASVELRKIIDKKTIDKVYEILRDRDFKIDTQTWNRRFRDYSQKIKTGSVFEIAMVLRDLSVLGADKELSFGEKKMLDMAQGLLASEIAVAKARPQDKVLVEIRSLFN